MLITTDVTIAYKCSACGSFEFFNISVFNALHAKELELSCRCLKSRIVMARENSKSLKAKIPCIGCGSEHLYVFNRKILYSDINTFYCPLTKMELCFIGKDKSVRRKVDMLEQKLDELIDMFGYESYFKNTRVMFDALNKIHDVAEEGNLYCECGNRDIELVLLPDRIKLDCKLCSGNTIIMAASNEDLKDILTREKIILAREYFGYEPRESRT